MTAPEPSCHTQLSSIDNRRNSKWITFFFFLRAPCMPICQVQGCILKERHNFHDSYIGREDFDCLYDEKYVMLMQKCKSYSFRDRLLWLPCSAILTQWPGLDTGSWCTLKTTSTYCTSQYFCGVRQTLVAFSRRFVLLALTKAMRSRQENQTNRHLLYTLCEMCQFKSSCEKQI